MRLRAGVKRIVVSDGDVMRRVVLDDGTELDAQQILSSAGWNETMRLVRRRATARRCHARAGQLSFVEIDLGARSLSRANLAIDDTIVFFNDQRSVPIGRSRDELVDVRSGVICSPNNYRYTTSRMDPPKA